MTRFYHILPCLTIPLAHSRPPSSLLLFLQSTVCHKCNSNCTNSAHFLPFQPDPFRTLKPNHPTSDFLTFYRPLSQVSNVLRWEFIVNVHGVIFMMWSFRYFIRIVLNSIIHLWSLYASCPNCSGNPVYICQWSCNNFVYLDLENTILTDCYSWFLFSGSDLLWSRCPQSLSSSVLCKKPSASTPFPRGRSVTVLFRDVRIGGALGIGMP